LGALVLALLAPYFDYVDWLGDEGAWLWGAERLLDGRHFRVGMFATSPTIYLAVGGWLALFGRTMLAARLFSALVVVGAALSIEHIARAARAPRWAAWSAAIGWVLMTQGRWTTVSHHWTSLAFGLCAIALALPTPGRSDDGAPERKPRTRARNLATGVLLTLALTTTPTAGLVAAAAIGAGRLVEHGRASREDRAARSGVRASTIEIVAGAAIALLVVGALAMGSGLVTLADLRAVPDCYRRFAPGQHVRLGNGATGANQAVPWLASTSWLALLLVESAGAARRGRIATWLRPEAATLIVAAALAPLAAFPRPDVAHLGFRLGYVMPALAVAIGRGVEQLPRWARIAPVLAVVGAGLFVARPYADDARTVLARPRVSLPRGTVRLGEATHPDALAALNATFERIPRDERFFFYPYAPMLPFLLARDHVAPTEIFTVGYLDAAAYADSCRHVLGRAQWILIDRQWSSEAFARLVFPNLADANPPAKRAFEAVLESQSTIERVEGVLELRRVSRTPDVGACRALERTSTPAPAPSLAEASAGSDAQRRH
jgi:hypothetical protein